MSKVKIHFGEKTIALRDVRAYYGKSTRLLSLLNMFFMTLITALGIYIADVISSSNEEHDGQVFGLYTVFMVGAVLLMLMLFSVIAGRKGEYEGALRFRRLLSLLSFAIGVLSLGVSLSIILSTYKEWEDAYTITIFMLQLAGGILTIITSLGVFVLSFNGAKYYDGKQLAKDIPENMSIEKNQRKYALFLSFSHIVFSVSVFLLSFYFAEQIEYFGGIDYENYAGYVLLYKGICIAGIVLCVLTAVSAILLWCLKISTMYILNVTVLGVTSVAGLVFSAASLLNIGQNFVRAGYPDVSYIIFGILLAGASLGVAVRAYAECRFVIWKRQKPC